ncbi:MAG: Transglycosylase domain [Thermotogaceae bacterium]|nr:Transglycosylase domain [Thermotogaceae bacterium]MDN5338008.1 Transglycosylase domain [Thermotogaceae bacterium]
MAFLITVFSFLSDDYFLNKKIEIYRKAVGIYHAGQSFLDAGNAIEVDRRYVSYVIEKYMELRKSTKGKDYKKIVEYINKKLETNRTLPPEIDKGYLANKILEAVLDATTGKVAKIFRIKDLEPELVIAIIERESSFNPFAFNPNGTYQIVKDNKKIVDRFPAYGLMQIWQPTFSWINDKYFNSQRKVEELFDIRTNIIFGSMLLQHIYNKIFLAHLAGIEPATSGSGVQRSIP